MAKGMFIGIDGKARKVKKMYVGIGGVARKVKKAYIGIDGKARLFWSGGGELKDYGTATPLSQKRGALAGVSVGDYALFAGGTNGSRSCLDTVDAYNSSLIRSTPTVLSQARSYLAGVSIGNYALFAGGTNDSNGYLDTVDVYAA